MLSATSSQPAMLPEGVRVHNLVNHDDTRGRFTEIFREEWKTGIHPVQWNLVSSESGVLRGVHVHVRHDDYLIWVEGKGTIGLRDLRPGSPTEGLSGVVALSGEIPQALFIPHGVAHGFYSHTYTVHLYAVSEYWDPTDELGCHWGDPALQIPWPAGSVTLSERDAVLPGLAAITAAIPPWQHA